MLMEKMPSLLRMSSGRDKNSAYSSFFKLLELYTDGVFSLTDTMELFDQLKHPDVNEELLMPLRMTLAAREGSRRQGNNLLKPLSEIDLSQFTQQDHVTPSYYKLPNNFPKPVCTGRDQQEPWIKSTMNDAYCGIPTGSENFKLKHKQEFEECLFKVEDSMYNIDH